MASSSQPEGPYRVFLSFRGPSRQSIVSYLYRDLKGRGIDTFIDEKLEKGEPITEGLIQAIEESRIAVIVFSQDFASSRWCLDEVAKIMDCKKKNKLIVLPVFYYVDPKEVREGRNNYKIAFDNHEKKHSPEVVKEWKEALKEAGNLFGWELNNWAVAMSQETPIQLKSREFEVAAKFRKGTSIQLGNKFTNEAELVESLVREIWMKLSGPLYVAKYPVGLDSRVDELKSMLDMDARDKVLTIKVWATRGMGKTTLARAFYNSIFKDFEGSAFVDDIRDTSPETEKMTRLQENLLSQILMTDIKLKNAAKGCEEIMRSLSKKRALLVLDGVENMRQMNYLAGEDKWFGGGSRIIVTTTDKGVLAHDRGPTYEVKALNDSDARELFGKHALRNVDTRKYEDFVNGALEYAKGLPLALEILGSTIDRDNWKSGLNRFVNGSDKSISGMLRKSYDGLSDKAQEIFLHVTCFFNGWSTKYVKRVIDSCEDSENGEIDYLIRRSLIRDENGTLKIYHLTERMGKDIVREQCHNNLKKCSRLWRLEDVESILSGNEEIDAVEAIVLALPNRKAIKIGSKAFVKLKNLKFLIMINVETDSRRSIRLPESLRWFEWPECRASSLRLASPNKLAVLAVRKHLCGEP